MSEEYRESLQKRDLHQHVAGADQRKYTMAAPNDGTGGPARRTRGAQSRGENEDRSGDE